MKEPNYIVGSGPDTQVLVGGLLEIIVALAGIGTAVTLYPVIKRQNQGVALGFVAMRTLEAATIFAGVVSLLSIVTLRQAGAGPQMQWSPVSCWTPSTTGRSCSDKPSCRASTPLLLGSLMYKSGLVPRVLPVLGLIGAPIIFASVIAKYFGVYDEQSVWSLLGALLIAVWEFSLGVYLTFKGFRPCAITAEMTATAATPATATSPPSPAREPTTIPFPLVAIPPAVRQPMPGHRGENDKLPSFHHHHDSRCPDADGGDTRWAHPNG